MNTTKLNNSKCFTLDNVASGAVLAAAILIVASVAFTDTAVTAAPVVAKAPTQMMVASNR